MKKKNPTYTHLFGTIRLLIFNKSPTYTFIFCQIGLHKYVSHWYMKQKKGFLRVDLGFLGLLSLCNCNYVSMYYSILLKSTYTFISFSENFPPIRLFSPILLSDFKKISHLYFYSEPSSIWNSRVIP